MVAKKKVTLSIDPKTYKDFQKYCEDRAIMLSKKIELAMKEIMKSKGKKVIGFIFLFLFLIAFTYAAVFQDLTQGDFDNGTYINTLHNGSAVVLSGENLTGNFTSQIFDSTGLSSWDNISWGQGGSYSIELSNNGQGSLMEGNVLLSHMNNNFSDVSGLSNDLTALGDAAFSTSARLGSHAGSFDGIGDYVTRIYDSDFDFGTGSFTIGGWFKTNGSSEVNTISVQVSTGSDDAEESSTGSMSLTSSDLELVNDDATGAGDQEVGIRFQNINIPQGAVITNAYINFTADASSGGSGSTNLTFYAEASDNAATFTTTTNDITNRGKTTASQNWTEISTWSVGSVQKSPDISSVVQEVIDRTGWTSGNSLVVIINGSGQRRAESFDGVSASAPTLVVEYKVNQYLVSRYDSDQGFKVWLDSSGKVSFGVDDDSTWGPDESIISSSAYNDNNWHYFSAVKENNDLISLYIDSSKVGSSNLSSTNAISVQVSTGSDDAEELVPSGTIDITSSDLELVNDVGFNGLQEVGVRFNSLSIPQGAVITNAYINFTVDEVDTESTNITFYAEASDNAGIFTTTANDITSRIKTTSFVNWTEIPAWNTVGSVQKSPDLSSIVQEVVNRTGWASGNSLVVIINGTGQRTAESYNGVVASAPTLVVEYTSSLKTLTSDSAPLSFGSDEPTNSDYFNGSLDEFAIWNRSLSVNEIVEVYQRGILKLNLTVRSCDDAICSGESFSDIVDSSSQTLNVSNNRYFQYKFDIETENISFSPELFNVTIGYTALDLNAPNINIISPLNQSYTNVSVLVNISASDDFSLESTWFFNGTDNVSYSSEIFYNFQQGSTTLIAYANDSVGNENSTSVTFFIDSISPTITIDEPQQGKTYGINTSLELNFTVSDSGSGIESCWYNLNNSATNTTIVGCQNTTFNATGDGDYSLIVYANDTLGNEDSSNTNFSVVTTAPALNLVSPGNNSYLNYTENIYFNYSVVSGISISSCQLWEDSSGTWNLNQTNDSISLESNFFILNLSENVYNWGIVCNDTQNRISAINYTFTTDITSPNLTLTEPTGTKSSRTGIPLTFSVQDSSPVSCLYNVMQGASLSISNTSVACNSTSETFSVSADGDFVLSFYVNDSARNTNSTNLSFSVDTSSSGGGNTGGGGSSGGGGGGGGSTSAIIAGVNKVEFDLLSRQLAKLGETKKLSLGLRNAGTNFLNNCKLKTSEGYDSWILYGGGSKNLAAGERSAFDFNLIIPKEVSEYIHTVELILSCTETERSTNLSVEIIEEKIGFEIIEVQRESENQVKVTYFLEELSGIEQNIELQFLLFGQNNEKVADINEAKILSPNSRQEFETLVDIDPTLQGELSLLVNLNSEVYSTFVEESVILGAPITGFQIFGESGIINNLASLIFIALFVVFAIFMVVRIISHRKNLKKKNSVKIRKHSTKGKLILIKGKKGKASKASKKSGRKIWENLLKKFTPRRHLSRKLLLKKRRKKFK